MRDPRSNYEILEALISSSDAVERAKERGNKDCAKERAEFGRLFSEVLARLDNTVTPFEPGDRVRVKPSEAERLKQYGRGLVDLDLVADELYVVDHCFYEGDEDGCSWMVAFTNMPSRPGIQHLGYGAHLFEKAKIVKAA